MKRKMLVGAFAVIVISSLAVAGTLSSPSPAPSPTPSSAPQYIPGLGDMMTLIQQRHAKLFFAGQGGNWDLAQYELKELNESLGDVVTYYPNFKTYSLTEYVSDFMDGSIAAVSDSILRKDSVAFTKAFTSMSQSCTKCHSATDHPFIAIQNPTTSEYTNLVFTKQSN